MSKKNEINSDTKAMQRWTARGLLPFWIAANLPTVVVGTLVAAPVIAWQYRQGSEKTKKEMRQLGTIVKNFFWHGETCFHHTLSEAEIARRAEIVRRYEGVGTKA